MTADKLYTGPTANTLTVKLTNQFLRTRFITPSILFRATLAQTITLHEVLKTFRCYFSFSVLNTLKIRSNNTLETRLTSFSLLYDQVFVASEFAGIDRVPLYIVVVGTIKLYPSPDQNLTRGKIYYFIRTKRARKPCA